jgi:hypothetical protein
LWKPGAFINTDEPNAFALCRWLQRLPEQILLPGTLTLMLTARGSLGLMYGEIPASKRRASPGRRPFRSGLHDGARPRAACLRRS